MGLVMDGGGGGLDKGGGGVPERGGWGGKLAFAGCWLTHPPKAPTHPPSCHIPKGGASGSPPPLPMGKQTHARNDGP